MLSLVRSVSLSLFSFAFKKMTMIIIWILCHVKNEFQIENNGFALNNICSVGRRLIGSRRKKQKPNDIISYIDLAGFVWREKRLKETWKMHTNQRRKTLKTLFLARIIYSLADKKCSDMKRKQNIDTTPELFHCDILCMVFFLLQRGNCALFVHPLKSIWCNKCNQSRHERNQERFYCSLRIHIATRSLCRWFELGNVSPNRLIRPHRFSCQRKHVSRLSILVWLLKYWLNEYENKPNIRQT